MACYIITLLAFFLSSYVFGLFLLPWCMIGLAIFWNFRLFSLCFCLLLFKGLFSPSSTDHGSSGASLFDYYWGTELYPRLFGWDVKLFTNCRFGMMSWPILLFSFAAKQVALYGFLSDSMCVAVFLQFVYITKFFIWERLPSLARHYAR